MSNSVRMIAPVGQTSRHGALTQCLHTSDIISQAVSVRSGLICSMNLTCRQLLAVSEPVLSYESPVSGLVWPGESPDGLVEPGSVVRVAGHELGVLHTPGHSPGCCCVHDTDSGLLVSGDTLFCGGPGATGRSHSDEPTILRSIRDVLLGLPDHTIVHTGHGETTTIGAERAGVLARVAELGLKRRRLRSHDEAGRSAPE